ncbi:hypothetical protein SPRG_01386 [Saprolegnia parasitica CBS 223.65]|uniref:FYVE-type domain-containing protein n=1 Tax=Saprolegnia parasitica (strain CBS 223.65) TaxID=695850 RepID=A0A067CXY7_SAPPC|nr:hypothetical protein SPRG_01386 [Saprolegnia parasitica CBS 223.65]KDO34115.1 hypothetical protein SPRG_01386 [Saprolegnia parasitica CBS 223.65]|eukprot:XP_012194993.1 hypothetical protein SPRG_01386 [Saprolegnia parasitica CBS 223.65]
MARKVRISEQSLISPTSFVASQSHCNLCTKKLHFFYYKHHCRVCGKIVCGKCKELALVELPGDKIADVKVCASCIAQVGTQATSISTESVSSGGSGGSAPRLSSSRYVSASVRVPRLSDLPELHGTDCCFVCARVFSTHHPKHQCRQCRKGVCYGCRMNANDPLFIELGLPFLMACWTCVAASDAIQLQSTDHFSSPLAPAEATRLEALYDLHILDSGPDAAFDILCDLASQEFNCPIAVVSFMDVNRQWFKAQMGLTDTEVPRAFSLCEKALKSTEAIAEWDIRLDAELAVHPLVQGGPRLRFYAGAPLLTPSGQAVGTIFVLDKVVHEPQSLGRLEELAAIAMKLTLAGQTF